MTTAKSNTYSPVWRVRRARAKGADRETYPSRDMSVVVLRWSELGGVQQRWYSRRTSLFGTRDRAGLRGGKWGEGTGVRNIRETGGALDAGQESTQEESVDGEAEETAKHDGDVERGEGVELPTMIHIQYTSYMQLRYCSSF